MNTRSLFRTGAVALTALGIATAAYAAALKPDATKSNISATFKQMNVPVDAKFKRFTAQIDYDAAKPESSKANMDLDIASFDMGEAEYNQEVLKKDWFNAAQFPKATFVSTGMKAGAAGSLNVTGTLTIKGKANTVTFPLTVKKDGNNTVFDGQLPIKRLAYSIGEGEWKDTSVVADDVVIKFHVVTAP
jgi:polyisoprenoid-binding protein YceI